MHKTARLTISVRGAVLFDSTACSLDMVARLGAADRIGVRNAKVVISSTECRCDEDADRADADRADADADKRLAHEVPADCEPSKNKYAAHAEPVEWCCPRV